MSLSAKLERPTGNPKEWTPKQWLQYNAWEAAQPEPPRLGPYENMQQFFESDEWLQIVRDTLDSHYVDLGVAQRANNPEAIAFYEKQIAACERDLGVTRKPSQQLLFKGELINA